jgi:hypothetical protein
MQPQPPAHQGMQGPPGPNGEIRNPFVSALLGMVTFGIYAWWWVFKLAGEINTFLGYKRFSPLKVGLLVSVSCGLYGFYFMFVDGKEIIKELQLRAGLPPDPPIIADLLRMQGAANKVWERIPG